MQERSDHKLNNQTPTAISNSTLNSTSSSPSVTTTHSTAHLSVPTHASPSFMHTSATAPQNLSFSGSICFLYTPCMEKSRVFWGSDLGLPMLESSDNVAFFSLPAPGAVCACLYNLYCTYGYKQHALAFARRCEWGKYLHPYAEIKHFYFYPPPLFSCFVFLFCVSFFFLRQRA